MASRGKYILDILRQTDCTLETVQRIITKPLPPTLLAYPHLYYKPFTRYATERCGTYDSAWEPLRFPFVPEQLPQLPEIVDPDIRERVFTHLSVQTNRPKQGTRSARKTQQWLASYKRYEGLGDVIINHAAMLAAEKSRTKELHTVATKLLSNNTLSYLAYSYQLHHELRYATPSEPRPPQKVFADIFEAYIGAVYFEAAARGEPQSIFDWLAELFRPSNWPDWPADMNPAWREWHGTVDTAALHRMLQTIIEQPASRGTPVSSLPRRDELSEAVIGRRRTSGRATQRSRRSKASKSRRLVKTRTITSSLKTNPYKALLLARRAAERAMLRNAQRLAGIPEPPVSTPDSVRKTKSNTAAAGTSGAAAPTVGLSANTPAIPVIVRAGPPALPAAWIRTKMAQRRAANRK